MSIIAIIGNGPIRPWAAGYAVALGLLAAVPSSSSKVCENINPRAPVQTCTVEAIELTPGHDNERAIDWWKDPPPRWLQATGTATEAPLA